MRRKTGSGAGNARPDAETADTFADHKNGPGGAVAHRDRRFELCFHSREGAHQAFAFDFVQNLFDEIRPIFRLSQQTFFAEIDF